MILEVAILTIKLGSNCVFFPPIIPITAKGMITIASDFDAPLPNFIIAAF